jgi:hypothetical protein
MGRSRSKPKRGPAPLSEDRFDKFLAAMHWYVARNKDKPEYLQAPAWMDAVGQWYDGLSLDHVELVNTINVIYNTPRYGGEEVAVQYAADLPAVPTPPAAIRRAWGHD